MKIVFCGWLLINEQHKKLADILGISEQRVRQYKDTDYQCASFGEILEVSTVLAGN